jgi:GT2 family glycosyltransferase
MPSVAVVVATRDRPENLNELVPAVLADRFVSVMVVVVDGGDRESVSVLESLEERFDRLIHRSIEPSGQLQALATGVSMTDAEVIVLLDDDVVPSPGLACAHARQHVGQSHLVLVGAMPVEPSNGGDDVGSILYSRDYLAHCARIEAGKQDVLHHLWLGNVSILRSNCLAVGLYSADFTASYHSDQDLGFRLAEAGLVGRYDPSLAAVHRHRRDGKAFLNDARRQGAGVAQLHKVHPELGPGGPALFTSDLPRPIGVVVRCIGATRMAPGAARILLGLSHAMDRVGWQTGRISFAQLARRFMLVWGATGGERLDPGDAVDAISEPTSTGPTLETSDRWSRSGLVPQSDAVPV